MLPFTLLSVLLAGVPVNAAGSPPLQIAGGAVIDPASTGHIVATTCTRGPSQLLAERQET